MQARTTDITTVLPTLVMSPPASSTPWGMVSNPARKKGAEARMAIMPPNMLLWETSLRPSEAGP